MKKIGLLGAGLTCLFLFVSFYAAAFIPVKGEVPVTSSSTESIKLFLEGREAFEMGRAGDAAFLFDKALEKDPKFAMANLYRALSTNGADADGFRLKALAERERVSRGEQILMDLMLNSSSDVTTRLEKGNELVKIYPDSPRALLLLANLYQEQNSFSKFRDLAAQVIMLDPSSPLGYRAYAASFLLNEPLDFDLALKYMQRFADLRPNEATAFIALGDVMRFSLKLDAAEKAYSRAVDLDPSSDVAYSKRGYVNTYLGNFEMARADFVRAEAIQAKGTRLSHPNYGLISYLSPGVCADRLEKFVVAGNESAIDRSERYAQEGESAGHYFCCTVISMLHGIYVAPNQLMDETECLERSLIKESMPPGKLTEPNFVFIETLRAIGSGDYELATKKAEQHARLLDPAHPHKLQVYHYLNGLISFGQGKYENAVNHYLKSDLNNNCVKYELGLAYDKTGNYEEAKRLLSEVAHCRFTSEPTPNTVKVSEKYMQSVAKFDREE